MENVHHCLECGREFTHAPFTGKIIRFGNDEGYCSEGCLRKHQAIVAKKHAEKALKKLNKQKDILQKKIDNISVAVREEDPGAIEKAIRGGLLKQAGMCLKLIITGIILYIVGLMFYNAGYAKRGIEERKRTAQSCANSTAGESAGATVESVVTTNANSAAIDMQKQKREDQLLERRRELLQLAGEDGNTSAPVAEQE